MIMTENCRGSNEPVDTTISELRAVSANAGQMRKLMKDILQEQHCHLQLALKNCLSQVASEMFTKKLISEPVKDEPTYDKLVGDFKAGIEFKDVSELQKYWQSFIEILSNQSGSAVGAADYLANELSRRLKSHNAPPSTCPLLNDKDSIKIVDVDREEEIMEKLEDLHEKFAGLMRQVRTELNKEIENKRTTLSDIARYAQDFITWENIDFSSVQSIDELFTKLHCYFDFLDCRVVIAISKEYITKNDDLIHKLEGHSKQSHKFRNMLSVKTLRESLLEIYNPHFKNPENAPTVHIKLNNSWDEAPIEGLYLLIRKFLPKHEKESLINHILILSGSVLIKYIVQASQVDCLIGCAQGKLQFMRLIGIFGLVINGTPILDEDENMNFSFDNALFEAAKVGHNEAAQFLLDLGSSLDVAFLEAAKGSHVRATCFLLELGAKIGTLMPLCATLDLSQLDEIAKVLKTNNFSPSNWFLLGLSLSLPQSTLDAIKAEHSNNVSQCLQKCLSQWLRKADDVVEKDGPTWSSLAGALRSIGEVASAEMIEIRIELSHPACQILLKHSRKLSQLILPVETLLTEGVISKEIFHELKKSGNLLVNGPLRALCTTVSKDHKQLKAFASILLQSRETIKVAQFILEEYETTFTSLHPSQISEGIDVLSLNDQKMEKSPPGTTFDQMRMYFIILFNTVAHHIEDKVPSLEDLKTYLQKHFDELRLQLEYAESLKQFMFLVKEKDTIIDINYIQAIVDYLDIEEVKDHIGAYKITMEEFCEETTLDICCNESFNKASTSLLKCETIEFVLEWKANEHSLRHVRALLQKGFQDMSKKVQVRYIKVDSNSVIVTCYAPRNIMDILQMEAKKNLELLKETGIIELKISYHFIWGKHANKILADKEEEIEILQKKITSLSIQLLERKEMLAKDNKTALLEKQEEIEILQEKITSQSLQLLELKGMNSQLAKGSKKKQEETEQLIKELTKQKESELYYTRQVEELTKKLEVEARMGRAKILEIEKLTRQKEAADKILTEKEEQIQQLTKEKKSIDKVLVEKQEQVQQLTRQNEAIDKVLAMKEKEINQLTRKKEATTLHGHTLFVRPQYDQLIELLDTLVNWQKFGTFLTGIERRDIERIEADTSIKGIDQQKAALFTKWLSVHPEASWEDVLFALEKSQEYSLVSRVYQKLNSTLSTASTISQNPQEVVKTVVFENEEEEELQATLEHLDRNFSVLLVTVRLSLDCKLQHQQLLLVEFIRWIEHRMNWVGELDNIVDSNDLFKKLHPYFDFLDCGLIVDMSEMFLNDECFGEDKRSLVSELKEHIAKANTLRCSSTVKKLKLQLKSIYTPHLRDLTSMPQINIKLQNPWNDATIQGLYLLIGHLLPYKSKHSILNHIEIDTG